MSIFGKIGRFSFVTACVAGVIAPTFITLLFAGLMVGKPKPCEIAAPCRAVPYSLTEALVLPLFTILPAVSMAALLLGRKKDD